MFLDYYIVTLTGTGFITNQGCGGSGGWIVITNDNVDADAWGDWFQLFWSDWAAGHDVSDKTHLQFYIKVITGSITNLSVDFFAPDDASNPGEGGLITNYITLSEEWTLVTIPINDLGPSLTNGECLVFKRWDEPLAVYGIDEIKFIGATEDLVWGDGNEHNAMQQTGGTTVEYTNYPTGGCSPLGAVSVNGVSASIVSWGENQIEAIIPAGANTGLISVTNKCGNSGITSSNFIIPGDVYIAGFSPSSGIPEDTVIITGTSFGAVQGSGGVWIDGVEVTNYNTWSDTNISILVPLNAKTGTISVTNECGKGFTTISNFIVYAAISVSKSISNITLGGIGINRPIPGATVIYKINYLNAGSINTNNFLIYDAMPINTKYKTNYMLPPTSDWTAQYSTNIVIPDQSYSSPYYQTAIPQKDKVKWVRWKNPSISANESGSLIYKVIIK